MTNAKLPVLLTSSVIAHDKGVRLVDPQERARLAMESVERWSFISPTTPLVLCDGSGFDFRPLVRALPNAHQIECLHFQNDIAAVQQYGRGYGEGEIIRYALQHASLIQSAGAFAKCTSKLWVENFSECVNQWTGDFLFKGVFENAFSPWRRTSLAYIDTRFYIARKNAYEKIFLDAHESVQADRGQSLEECFRDVFLEKQLSGCLMSHLPVISGVGGGTGTYYKNTRLRQHKERCRYSLIKMNPNFKYWFSKT